MRHMDYGDQDSRRGRCVRGCLGNMPSCNKMVSRMGRDDAATNMRRAGPKIKPQEKSGGSYAFNFTTIMRDIKGDVLLFPVQRIYVVARYFFLVPLSFSARPCLAVA